MSIALSIIILSTVIALGKILGKCKIFGISLGVTWILFVGILFSHFGYVLDGELLHFTKELLKAIEEKGINICYITLHVGLGTFRPVNVEDVTKHKMHSEFYHMSKEVADILNNAKENNKRIIAVGTTSTRALETIMSKYNCFKCGAKGWVTYRKLIEWNIFDTDWNMQLAEYYNNDVFKGNYYKINMSEIAILYNNFISDNKISELKLKYINNRL